ncbi:MAG: ATP-binding protein [Deltaproteobacteria bacterium]|nr:ATP-binding protein [Deltaproteobacteria bacterium]
MIEEFRRHNLFVEGFGLFQKQDPHLSYLSELRYVSPLDWWKAIDWKSPGILILTGGRQIGKTTSTKLLIEAVLKAKRFSADSIFFLPADQILDHFQLTRILRFFLEGLPNDSSPFLLLIDEITFVKDWDRSIKALADEGWFRRGFCLLTGSDSVILKEAASRFPGRRGRADQVDFHLHPLSFREYVNLMDPSLLKNPEKNIEKLFTCFGSYLQCGGYLRAINDLHGSKKISLSTYATFEQWVRGDFLKRGKSEENLLKVLQALIEVGVSQSSYSNLATHSGLSKDSLIDYVELLQRMDIVFTLEAYDSSKKIAFPKKAKKFHFADPFIQNTLEKWLVRERRIQKESDESLRVESCVASQYQSKIPSYYLKAEGEIDLVMVLGKHFLPLEVKWANQIRANDLKQLKKYPSSILLSKSFEKATYEGIRVFPLPLFLLEYFEEGKLRELI